MRFLVRTLLGFRLGKGIHIGSAGAVYLSANTRQETIETFLRETWQKVQDRAQAIHSGKLTCVTLSVTPDGVGADSAGHV